MLKIIVTAIAAIIIFAIIALPITWKAAIARKTKEDADTIGTAEDKARGIIDDAIKTAETKKRESLLEVKEQSLAAKNEVDREIK
jgi:ribonuclease Y